MILCVWRVSSWTHIHMKSACNSNDMQDCSKHATFWRNYKKCKCSEEWMNDIELYCVVLYTQSALQSWGGGGGGGFSPQPPQVCSIHMQIYFWRNYIIYYKKSYILCSANKNKSIQVWKDINVCNKWFILGKLYHSIFSSYSNRYLRIWYFSENVLVCVCVCVGGGGYLFK